MILKNGSFQDMALQIERSESDIIVFGAGMIGTITTPALLQEYHLDDRVSFYADNDPDKWGKCVTAGGMEYHISSPDALKNINGNSSIILLAISRFSDSLSQLESMENLKNAVCYIVPMMCITNFKISEAKVVEKRSRKPLIPKVIHYMWLGEKEIPRTIQACIDSWKKYCPDYEIRRWDESNYDIGKNEYMKQAYEKKMYGFVPDYARLDILYTYGGIYLDADVELIRNLDDMLYQDAFCCVEKWQTINFGGGSGSVQNSKAIGELLEEREHLLFVDEHGNMNKNTCGYYDTIALQKRGYKICGKIQNVLDLTIYPYDVFHPYDYMSGRIAKSINTYGIHHFNGGWMDEAMKEANRKASEEFERIYRLADKNII